MAANECGCHAAIFKFHTLVVQFIGIKPVMNFPITFLFRRFYINITANLQDDDVGIRTVAKCDI
jgi:hypothetical protein